MTADDIRKELENNSAKLYKFCDGSERMLQLLQYAAQMEIAAQLAELNSSLNGLTIDKAGRYPLRVT